MSMSREFPEITDEQFNIRLENKIATHTSENLREILAEYYETDILAEYKKDAAPKTNYAVELERFEINILPSVINMFGLDDMVAICKAWSNWVDVLCKDGRITKYQRDNWENPF